VGVSESDKTVILAFWSTRNKLSCFGVLILYIFNAFLRLIRLTNLDEIIVIPMHPNKVQVLPWYRPFQNEKEHTVNN
jgi:hypothetical protein